jgi:cellulose synthase/poly-beta-1,6-N-acetylglucosamine synthase-like glycosyltransferase
MSAGSPTTSEGGRFPLPCVKFIRTRSPLVTWCEEYFVAMSPVSKVLPEPIIEGTSPLPHQADSSSRVPLSVIVPAFNEQDRVLQNLREISCVLPLLSPSWEIILVDDGSPRRDGHSCEAHKRRLRPCGCSACPATRAKGRRSIVAPRTPQATPWYFSTLTSSGIRHRSPYCSTRSSSMMRTWSWVRPRCTIAATGSRCGGASGAGRVAC